MKCLTLIVQEEAKLVLADCLRYKGIWNISTFNK